MIVVLSTSYLTYTVIPIYASMKAVDSGLFEAARDLGAGWFTTFRRVLLPLIAPGIFIALLLVYVPLFTDFAAPTLVGGTSGYMLGNVVSDLVLENGNLNAGAAMSFIMLIAAALFSLLAYQLSRDQNKEPSELRRSDRRRRPQRARRRLLPGAGRAEDGRLRAPRHRRRLLRDRGVRPRLPAPRPVPTC